MRLSTYRYRPTVGWDKPLDSALDSDNTLLIVFGGSDADALASGISDLCRAFPRSTWIGCSTAGEIYDRTLEDHTLTLAVMKFTATLLRIATRKIVDPDASFQVGSYLANTLAAPDLKGLFVLSDGLTVNGSELAKGLSQNLPPGVVVTGGLAGDGDRFQKTWVLVDKTPQSHHVVAVGLYSEQVGIAHGSRGGWDSWDWNARSRTQKAMCSIPWMDNLPWLYTKNISVSARQACQRLDYCFRWRYAMTSKKMV